MPKPSITLQQAQAIAANTTLTAEDVLKASIAPDDAAALCIHDMRLQQAPDSIQRVEEADGRVRWKGMMLLSPGVWTDAGSGESVFYSPEGIENSHKRWEGTRVNFFHEYRDETWAVGDVDPSTATVDDKGRLFADVVLSMENKASELADEALQKAFETRGREGIKGPSVELRGEEYRFNTEHGVKELTRGTFTGLGFVGVGLMPGPASTTASFEAQARERAVAMAAARNGQVRVLTLKDDVNPHRVVPGVTLDLDEVEPDELSLADHAAPILAKKWGMDKDTVLSMLQNTEKQLQDDEEGEEGEGEDEVVTVDPEAVADAIEGLDDEEKEQLIPTIVEEIAEALDAEPSLIASILSGEATTAPRTILEAIAERLNVDPGKLQDDEEDEDEDEEDTEMGSKLQEVLDKLTKLEEGVDKRLSKLEARPKAPKSLADAGTNEPEALDLDGVRFLGHHTPRQPLKVNP